MFAAFGGGRDPRTGGRYATATAAAVSFYCVAAGGILLVPHRTEPKAEENLVDVTFRPPPERPRPPPTPPPLIPESMKVKKVKTPKPATALVEPQVISKQKLEEADPKNDQVEVGEGGDDSAGGGSGPPVAAAVPPPPPPPPPPPKPVEAITLPEEGVPPVAASTNVHPDFPAEARSRAQE